jgi:20S proteasome alpha/beta subunit
MTIAVGVLATRGVVLVADTQLTYGTFAKSQGGKIMAVTRRRSGAFALTGATDRIGYLSAVGETLADDFMAKVDTTDKAKSALRFAELLHEFHARHVVPFPDLPSVELLIAYGKGEEFGLWQSDRSTLSERHDHGAVGIGAFVANVLLGRLWKPGLDVPTAVALAIYVVSVVKGSVDGCGLYTQALAVEESCHYVIPQKITDSIDDLSRVFSEQVQPAMVIRCFGEEPFDAPSVTLDGFSDQMIGLIAELRKRTPKHVMRSRIARVTALTTKARLKSTTETP